MSFFKKLTGGGRYVEEDEDSDLDIYEDEGDGLAEPEMGELTVDVYQTDEDIVIEAMVAGSKPDELDIEIGRETVIVSGERSRVSEATDGDYFVRELTWGSFSRTITLPQEVEPDQAEAHERHGVLVLTLPKVNKDKKHKVRVKARAN